jgi:O-antigen ligase
MFITKTFDPLLTESQRPDNLEPKVFNFQVFLKSEKWVGNRKYFQSTIKKWIAVIYALLLAVASTRLPVDAWWMRIPESLSGFAVPQKGSDSLIFLIQLPAIAWSLNNLGNRKHWTASSALASLLIVLIGVSTIWATVPSQTISNSIVLTCTFLSIYYLLGNFGLLKGLCIQFLALQIPIICSWWAANHLWGLERYETDGSFTGSWLGIYTNRNFLAANSAFAAILGMSLMILLVSKRKKLPVVVAGTFVGIDIMVMMNSKSGATRSMVGIFLILLVLLSTYIFAIGSNHGRSKLLRRITVTVCSIGFVGWHTFVYIYNSSISQWLGESPNLSGRAEIWRAGGARIMDRPFLGWGFFSPWFTNTFRQKLPTEVSSFYWSHNTHLDFALGLGVIGFTLYFLWFLFSLSNIFKTRERLEQVVITSIFLSTFAYLSMEALSSGFFYIFCFVLVMTSFNFSNE